MNAIEYIRKKIKEYDSDIDTSKGSPVADLMINPLSSILEPTLNFEKRMLRDLSLQDVNKMSEEALDEMARNFLVDRISGSKASGDIRLFYDTPVAVTIPQGTIFSTDDGLQYQTTSEFSVTRAQMMLNNESYPLYHTGDINIEALSVSKDYNTLPNTIVNLDSTLDPAPSAVRNPQAVSGATEGESNTDLKTKIISTAHNKALGGKNSILRVMREKFPTVKSIEVIGTNDPEMTRDIVYSGISTDDLVTVDYQYKVSGLASPPHNESIAYIGKFEDTDASTDISLPAIDDFSQEFTNTMYEGVYESHDPLYAEYKTDYLLEEYFTNSGYAAGWVASDAQIGYNDLNRPRDVAVNGAAIQLGYTIKSSNTDKEPINLPYKDLDDWHKTLDDFVTDENVNLNELQGLVDEIQKRKRPQNFNSVSPVFQRQLSKHQGIQIEGTFWTDDSSENGKISYVTVNRNQDIAVPWDGIGFAWRKGDGSKYNLYIVDNDALSEEIFVGNESMLTQTGGINDFLVAGKKQITTETEYDFTMKIYSHFGIDLWIYESNNSPAELNAANRDLTMGQTYPKYEPQAAGEDFGLAVQETSNSSWRYRDIVITNITQFYPMHLFKMKTPTESFADGKQFIVNYYGIGHGENNNALKFYINKDDNWVKIGENTAGESDTIEQKKIIKTLSSIEDYRDTQDYIYLLATPYNYQDSTHNIESNYISVDNVLPSGIHRGNVVDIYTEAKSQIEQTTLSTTLTDNKLYLQNESSTNFPVADIISISRTTTGSELVEGTDYVVSHVKTETSFSTRDNILITFDASFVGIGVTVAYRYYTDGSAVQSLVESADYRNPGQDPLFKIMPLTIVNLNTFEYKGLVSVEEMKEALVEQINNISDGILEISDLIGAAYDAGATYVNLTTTDVSVREYDYLGNYTESKVTDSHTISGLKTYFADTTSVAGVSKVG